MEVVSMRELSKSPKTAFDKLTTDGKAVITNNPPSYAFCASFVVKSLGCLFVQ
jgi:hypothetical protein